MKRLFFAFVFSIIMLNLFANPASKQTYKIGETGPAGGLVFYDKGSFSNGWQYLEAAPAEKEFTAEWGANQKNVPGTYGDIGTGKDNTKLIVERLQKLKETGKAAQMCTQLNINGFTDWFLPSIKELELMQANLKKKGLGGFANGPYWSSTLANNQPYHAWTHFFGFSGQGSDDKNIVRRVRAARAF